MEKMSTKRGQKTGTRKGLEEGAGIFSRATQENRPEAGPWGRSEGGGRASLASLCGRAFQAEGMAKMRQLKGAFFLRFGGLQRDQRGWRGREENGAGSISWRGRGTKVRDFLQTVAAFTLSEMRSHWGL